MPKNQKSIQNSFLIPHIFKQKTNGTENIWNQLLTLFSFPTFFIFFFNENNGKSPMGLIWEAKRSFISSQTRVSGLLKTRFKCWTKIHLKGEKQWRSLPKVWPIQFIIASFIFGHEIIAHPVCAYKIMFVVIRWYSFVSYESFTGF